jgi:hypothetical protein
MTITPEESEAYRLTEGRRISEIVLRDALRRHVAAEMRLEFEVKHLVPHPYKTAADWDRAADEALRGAKSDE